MNTRTALVLIAATVLATASGCTSRQTGKLGNLVFSYVADDQVTDFNKPVAVGAKLDVYVRQKGNNKPITISAADTANSGILKIDKFEPSFFTLSAVASGSTEITVKAQLGDGQTVEDKVDMRAANPEVLKMHHYCTKEADAYYLTEQPIYVPYDMEMKDGEAVIGYGLHPIDIEPAGAITLFKDGKNQAHFKMQTPKTAQTITLKSTLDESSLIVSVTDETNIDGARYEGAQTVLINIKTPVLVRPTIAGKPVCQANTSLHAASTTPDICAAKALTTAKKGDDKTSSWGWIEIDGKQLGKCTFQVTYLKANDRAGLTVTFTVDVAKLVKP